jgi:sugar O-acyltransferase (sialic acid O-acetyltransferase NeuD family)
MIIVGAGGHGSEVYEELLRSKVDVAAFYDEVNSSLEQLFELPVIHDASEMQLKDFVLAVGKPSLRKGLFERLLSIGAHPCNVIAATAQVSLLEVDLGSGLNIMHSVYIGPRVSLGNGTLINAKSSIHHDTKIGSFCEVCIGVTIAGRCTIEDEVFIGMGALILPGINIGKGAILGAGAVVTKDVPAGATVKGIPAK